MSETIRDIVTFALREAGVTGLGQDPLSEDIQAGYRLFVRMLAQWQVKRWLVPGLTDISGVSTGNISDAIGPGRHYNTNRPDKILAAYFVQRNTQSPVVSYPLVPIFSYEDYAKLSLKTLNSFPGWFFYDNFFPVGNVYVWPVPALDLYDIHLIVKQNIQEQTVISAGAISAGGAAYTAGAYPAVALTGGSGSGAVADITVHPTGFVSIVTLVSGGMDYRVGDVLTAPAASIGGTGAGFTWIVSAVTSSLDTEINLPDEYLEAIHYNLCVRLVAHYQYDPNPVQGVLAKTALNVIKNANAQVPRLIVPFANRSGFNIYAPDVYQ